jgi:hypothetical protein
LGRINAKVALLVDFIVWIMPADHTLDNGPPVCFTPAICTEYEHGHCLFKNLGIDFVQSMCFVEIYL